MNTLYKLNENMIAKIDATTRSLLEYCRKNDWAGYDPYDALNSRVLAGTPLVNSKICRIAVTQALKRLPVDVRPILRVTKEHNPKALGLFVMALLKLVGGGQHGPEDYLRAILEKLVALRSPGTPYWCWGYSFSWQGRTVLVPKWEPNLVCTVFVANALLDMYEYCQDRRFLNMATSAADYILNELFWDEGEAGAGFSYPRPGLRIPVHNANFLAAALLCRIDRHGVEGKYVDRAMRVTRYSAARQHTDGSWDYGELAKQRWVDNFHTGYNLCALRSIGLSAHTSEFDNNLRRGFSYYRKHFFREDGAPRYYHNRTYPLDIHSVAQSIITLVELRDLDQSNLDQANAVLEWAIGNMWDKRGYFYYQILPYVKNKISYMRWSQAWMLLALTTLSMASEERVTQ